MKLEEKHQALEEEKNQLEAKLKVFIFDFNASISHGYVYSSISIFHNPL